MFNSSLNGLGGTGGGGSTRAGKFENLTGFSVNLFLSLLGAVIGLTCLFLLNWDKMFCLNDQFLSSVLSLS